MSLALNSKLSAQRLSLTGPRDFIQAAPEESIYETGYRRSDPTIVRRALGFRRLLSLRCV
jgi:hypothetical protein